jgi:anti-sigma B factor antagonist
MRPGEFQLRHEAEGHAHTLRLLGEFDLATAPQLEAVVKRICAAGASELLLDLSALAFMDSTGLRAILLSQQLCEEHGCTIRLTPATGQVKRLFELTGLEGALPFGEVRTTPSSPLHD